MIKIRSALNRKWAIPTAAVLCLLSGIAAYGEENNDTQPTRWLNFYIPGYEMIQDQALPVPRNNMSLLTGRINKLLSTINGDWSVSVLDLSTNEQLLINDVSMPSASELKLFILGAAYDAVAKGEIDRTSELVAMLSAMIRVSSNGDANRIIYLLGHGDLAAGMERVNTYITEHGFSEYTHAYNGFQDSSTVLDPHSTNCTSAKDITRLLSMVYHRTFSTRKNCNETEDWMLGQELRYKIPSAIPGDVSVGNKTGETDTTENDAAVVYSPGGDYILCVLSHGWSSKSEAQSKIKEISAEVYRYFTEKEYAQNVSSIPTILYQNNLESETENVMPAPYAISLERILP